MKIQHILKLYDALLCGERINRSEFCKERHIAERSFYRYMHVIAEFIKDNKPDCRLIKPEEGVYYLKFI